MSANDVVSIGLHIVDVLGRPVTEIPPGQGMRRIDEIAITVAGTAAATSVGLARLGVRVESVGALGEDSLGRFLRQKMLDEGVGCAWLTEHSGVPTSATMLPIRPDGSRPALHVVGANAVLEADHVPWSDMAETKVLHLGGTCLLPGLDGEPAARVLERARNNGLITTLDLIPTGDATDLDALLPALPHVDYVFPSYEDALSLAGTDDGAEAARFFLDAGAGCVVITMGGDGACLTARGRGELRRPAYDVDVVDTTGCGDAFAAGFITGLVEGASEESALELGLACGSLVATGLGSDAGLTDRAALTRFMAATPRRDKERRG
ncbi:sugar kinase [Prauserella sp. PE36]|uniref:carbohydrate kinase family protein n=1 Tax=Prauserella sp. PE36 TaxID=1504709 RepID=UPI000DE4149E|nr:sugar kinase [Prauserella sp. PE36]RBM17176.1 sugar kinase [Prauserella sp. PE36]